MKKRIRAFSFALKGIVGLSGEFHFRVHILAFALVVTAGTTLGISSGEWVDLMLISALVLSLEGINSAVESLADAVHPDHHPLIKRSKDIAAGAVLIAAIFAVVIAIITFTPYITSHFA